MSDIRVRAATRGDVPAIVRFQQGLARETENFELERARVEKGVAAVLEQPAKGRYWVAERDGRVLGSLLVTLEWSDWRNAWFWWIQSVYTDPEARRTGIYRALHQHVIEAARRSEHVCGVRLYVLRENERAQAVYESLGMERSPYRFYKVDF